MTGYNSHVPPSTPIVVRVVEEPLRGFGLGDVLLSAIGISGVIFLGALLLGLVLGGLFIWVQKLRSRGRPDETSFEAQHLRLTPHG